MQRSEKHDKEMILEMCKGLFAIAESISKNVKLYKEEIALEEDVDVIRIRRVSILRVAYSAMCNILWKSAIYVGRVSDHEIEQQSFYRDLIKYITLYNQLSDGSSSSDASTQTDFPDILKQEDDFKPEERPWDIVDDNIWKNMNSQALGELLQKISRVFNEVNCGGELDKEKHI